MGGAREDQELAQPMRRLTESSGEYSIVETFRGSGKNVMTKERIASGSNLPSPPADEQRMQHCEWS